MAANLIGNWLHDADDESNYGHGHLVIILLILSMILIAITSNKYVHNETLAMVLGILVGVIISNTPWRDYMINREWSRFFVIHCYYPIVVIKLVYNCDVHMMIKTLPSVLVILIVCVLPIFITVGFLMTTSSFSMKLSWYNILTEGTVLGSHGAMLPKLNSDRTSHLESVLIAESILGTALAIGIKQALNVSTYWYQTIFVVCRIITIGVVMGGVCGYLLACALRLIYNDRITGIVLIISGTYVASFVCMVYLNGSGVICMFVIMVVVSRERDSMSRSVDLAMQVFINTCHYNITTLIGFLFALDFVIMKYSILMCWRLSLSALIYGMLVASRFFWFIALYPILSRIKKEYNIQTVMAICWCFKIEPVNFTPYLMTNCEKFVRTSSGFFGIYLFANLLNMSSSHYLLRRLGFLDWSKFTESGIQNATTNIMQERNRHLNVLKTDRTYNDVRMDIILNATKLSALDKYQNHAMDKLKWLSMIVTCPICSNAVSFEPTTNEMSVFVTEVRVRILKALKVSFVRQFEEGYLDNSEIKILLQTVDEAMNSEDLSLQYQDLKKYHKLRHKRRATRCKFLRLDLNQQKIPKTRCRRRCYTLVIKKYFERFYLIMNVLCVFTALVQICFAHYTMLERISTIIVDTAFQVIFLGEILVKILSYSDTTVFAGFLNYMRVGANVISFALFAFCCVDFVIYTVYVASSAVDDYILGFYLQLTRITRLLRLLLITVFFSSQLEAFFTKYKEHKIMHSFSVAMAMVRGLDEIVDILPNLTENNRLLQIVKTRIDTDKLQILKDFGLAELAIPHTSVRVKTKQAILITLKAISCAIHDLKSSGLIDDYEYNKLVNSLEERLQTFITVKSATVVPKNIVYELPWIQNDIGLFNYIYANVDTRIWKPGDTIVRVGEMIQGIFIIVSGILKISYTPSVHLIEKIHKHGVLPVKDYIRNTKYSEHKESYATVGNSFGELCLMTKRPYNVTITAFAPSQTFVVPQEVVEHAISMNRDPINGVQSRMWLFVVSNLIKSILRHSPVYQSMTFDDLNNMLYRAFVPNLVCFKMFVITEFIQDVLLVEGLVSDYLTGVVYTAPCHIPRMTEKIFMGEPDNMRYQPILVIIPLPDLDEYEVMNYSEAQSELIPNHDTDCLLHAKHYHSKHHSTSRMKNYRLKVKTSASPSVSLQNISAGKLLSTITINSMAGNSMIDNSSLDYLLTDDPPAIDKSATSTTIHSSRHNI